MLRSAQHLFGYRLGATDGEIGRCTDLLFDDEFWTVRYFVIDTGGWLAGRKVVASPVAFGEPDWASHTIPVRLTKQQIQEGPSLEEHAPVSRRYELEWFRHHGWSPYWYGTGVWGTVPVPTDLYQKEFPPDEHLADDRDEARHLRSAKEVKGYHIHATDGQIGHVHDFIVEAVSWTIRYLVVDTRNWLPGRKVLVSPLWVNSVDWDLQTVDVNLDREAVRHSPQYDSHAPINRQYETRLYDYYGRPAYWLE